LGNGNVVRGSPSNTIKFPAVPSVRIIGFLVDEKEFTIRPAELLLVADMLLMFPSALNESKPTKLLTPMNRVCRLIVPPPAAQIK
jgi:hypothetical protein